MKSTIFAAVCAFVRLSNALNPVLVNGNVFYDSVTNERVFFKGADYQPLGEQGIDPLLDPEACKRDLFLMQQLGANVMRVYTVDPTKNHDECMSIYNAGGIYFLLDVNSGAPGHYLNRDQPYTTYNREYVTNVFTTMAVFSGYSNVIGFFTGNELINAPISASTSPPYIKALTRDMKAYSAAHLDRPVLLGYSAADNIDYRVETAQYMACGDSDDGKSDFYAINSYQFCGKQTLQTSGYDALIAQFKGFHIPLFFSEIGCNAVKRTFQETDYVFGPEMTPEFSGCLVYQWTQEANNYGLVELSADGDVKLLHDYDALQSQYHKVANLPKDVPKIASKTVPCPPTSSFKAINGSATLPRLAEVEQVIKKGVSARPGKLRDVELSATKYKITDSRGNEITEKTPKRVSGVSHINLKPLLSAPGYAPSKSALSDGSGTGSGSVGDDTGAVNGSSSLSGGEEGAATGGKGTVKSSRADAVGTSRSVLVAALAVSLLLASTVL